MRGATVCTQGWNARQSSVDRQSVGELGAVHRHANCEPQGVLLRLSETRPRHTGRRPALSFTKVQPASRALRDFAKR